MLRAICLTALSLYSSVILAAYKIYHGHNVMNDEQFSFVVAIYRDSECFCTGTVVADKWILTAGHCASIIKDEPSIKIEVGTGYKAVEITDAKKVILVTDAFLYNNQFDKKHDIALLKLKDSVDVRPIQLPSSSQSLPNLKSGDQRATAVGFGFTEIAWSKECDNDPFGEDCYPDLIRDKFLHFGTAIIQTDQTTEELLEKYIRLEHVPQMPEDPKYNRFTMLGITSPDGTRPLNGDSGGPLLILNKENGSTHYIQVGVASWGILPNVISLKEGYIIKEPMIYINLADQNALDFIHKTIKNNS